jgi:hypothetical protein
MNANLQWLIGFDSSGAIEQIEFELAAPWARETPFWLFLALVAACGGTWFYYHHVARSQTIRWRGVLVLCRAAVLMLLVATLADPTLRVVGTHLVPPTVFLVVDGTESMTLADGGTSETGGTDETRLAAVQRLLADDTSGLARILIDRECDVEAFLFEGTSTSRLRRLWFENPAQPRAFRDLASQLSARGQVTALGNVVDEVMRLAAERRPTAVILISDFAQNAGRAPLASDKLFDESQFRVPLTTIGVGDEQLRDLAVRIELEPRMKVGENAKIDVAVSATQITHAALTVELRQSWMGEESVGRAEPVILRQEASIERDEGRVVVSFPFVPSKGGWWEFEARVGPVDDEIAVQNNVAVNRAWVTDRYLRILYVAFEPNWEWRFVKEIFHRDPLVGPEGFRTYLESAAPQVRRSSPLFLETLATRRDQFFEHDVVILDDVPAEVLTDRFCDLTEEFVGSLGGSLVILAGPRFGPSLLEDTALSKLLPVSFDRSSGRPRQGYADREPFAPELTAAASLYRFMTVDATEPASRRTWGDLSLPWYWPVDQVDMSTVVLAEHPVDLCRDRQTRQPLIAVRRYGQGEVIYFGFNELWRLRSGQRTDVYRRLWSQLIFRLSMSHALGDAKRFTVRVDRPEYRVGDTAVIAVEAYDADYQLLETADGLLEGQMLLPPVISPLNDAGIDTAKDADRIVLSMVRPGFYEARVGILRPGPYTLRMTDPIDQQDRLAFFTATDASAEQQDPARNSKLQQELSRLTGGRAYDLTSVATLPEDLDLDQAYQAETRIRRLWATPGWFLVVVGMMYCDWFVRRWKHFK